MLLFLTVTMTFMTVYFVFYTVIKTLFRNKNTIGIRLEKISKEDMKSNDSELNQPLFIRIIKPVLDDISKTILKITPKEFVNAFDKKVIMAGNPFNLTVKDWINFQVVIILCLPLLSIALGYYRDMEVRSILFLIMVEISLGLILPNLILNKKVADRQKSIRNSLPDILDLLTVSVEAGLGFDGALARVIEKMPGPLATEFGGVLQEIKVGKQKRDALRDMAERVGVQDLTTFISSIIQADQLGVSIGNVLRIQSEQMRQKRRQRAQEKAMKAPVKMLIPMILFIFPTIFSVLIGPVIINIANMLMK
ncbi:MAG: type II secretion system F family protein [Clostridia bacterium]|nr:type II secretion system F family protein [Clostridia bacterium]